MSFLKKRLPAIATVAVKTTTAAAATFAATTTTAAAAATIFARTGNVDSQRALVVLFAVKKLNAFLGFCIGFHFDEAKTA